MKTCKLTGRALDWAVWATQVGPKNIQARAGYTLNIPRFSTDWSICGKLIEKYHVWVSDDEGLYVASCKPHVGDAVKQGETPLIAICRAVVYLALGDNIDIPSGVVTK